MDVVAPVVGRWAHGCASIFRTEICETDCTIVAYDAWEAYGESTDVFFWIHGGGWVCYKLSYIYFFLKNKCILCMLPFFIDRS